MRQNPFVWLVGILIVVLLAGYVSFFDKVGFGDMSRDTHTRLGLDLQGGLQLVLQAEPQTTGGRVTSDQLDAARNIIEQRANGTGAAEPVVQTAEGNRILVELPGIQDIEDARRIIQETAFLEIVDGGTTSLAEGTLITTDKGGPRPEQLRQETPTVGGTSATAAVATGTVTSTTGLTSTGTTGSPVAATPTAAANASPTAAPTAAGKVYTTIVTGDDLDSSKIAVTFGQGNQPEVAFTLKGDGSKRFCDYTTGHVNQYMPITLDKKVISSPVIQSAICGGNGVITMGGSSNALADARRLATQLKYGALPVSLTLQSERKISATLGKDAIDRSIIAGIIGLGLVMLFMMVYYRLPGVLASLALLIYSLIVYAVFRLVPVTLTLAGIAGFILSIGMAVDANVLIFARLKEEIRSGKTLPAAVEAGFDHAWPSIRDSNASTLITCAILFWFGSTFGGASIIKGFALTLAIGVLVSLFSAITVTRTFLRVAVRSALANSKFAFHIETRRPPAPSTPTPAAE